MGGHAKGSMPLFRRGKMIFWFHGGGGNFFWGHRVAVGHLGASQKEGDKEWKLKCARGRSRVVSHRRVVT